MKSITILWGLGTLSAPYIKTYTFRTKAEVDAFLLGISEVDSNYNICDDEEQAQHELEQQLVNEAMNEDMAKLRR